MSLCETYFGKPINKLKWEDIETFFKVERKESEHLEFKSGRFSSKDELFNKLHTSISAFLNTGGGIYIVGAPIKTNIGKNEVYIGELSPLTFSISKDSIVSSISDKIQPVPYDYKVWPIDNKNDNQSLLIIEINKSPLSPHMVSGDRYYMRVDGQNRPASHHYVEALMKKISLANLDLSLIGESLEKTPHNSINLRFSLNINNLSDYQIAQNVVIKIRPCWSSNFSLISDTNGIQALYSYTDIISVPLPKGMPHTSHYTLEVRDFNNTQPYLPIAIQLFGINSPLKYYVYIFKYNLDIHEPLFKRICGECFTDLDNISERIKDFIIEKTIKSKQ